MLLTWEFKSRLRESVSGLNWIDFEFSSFKDFSMTQAGTSLKIHIEMCKRRDKVYFPRNSIYVVPGSNFL